MKSWIEVQKESDFPIQNIPFGIIRKKDGNVCCHTHRTYVIDLYELASLGYFDGLRIPDIEIFNMAGSECFYFNGETFLAGIRDKISELFEDSCPLIRDNWNKK